MVDALEELRNSIIEEIILKPELTDHLALEEFSGIQKRFVLSCSLDQESVQQVTRVIAKQKFLWCLDRPWTLERVNAQFLETVTVGFGDLWDEATVVLAYTYRCMQEEKRNGLRDILKALELKLNEDAATPIAIRKSVKKSLIRCMEKL